ncbi:MAG: hypothetical protein ACTSPK_00160 [Candidatus Heimdallarchaeota archaeon]
MITITEAKETPKADKKEPTTKVEIKDPEVYAEAETPPDFDENFAMIVVREQFLNRMAEPFSAMHKRGYKLLCQVNCYSRDVHLIFEKIRKGK